MKKICHNKLLEIAKNIAKEISSAVVKESRQKVIGLEAKKTGTGGDESKYGDIFVENLLYKKIKKIYENEILPSILLISEETGVRKFGKINDNSIFIIVDPIDGSSNMREWRTPAPFLAFSIALGYIETLTKIKNINAVEVGLVKDIFHEDICFAIRNKGSYCNDIKIKSSPEKNIKNSIIGISLDVSGEKYQERIKLLKPILEEKAYQRRIGSSILDMTKVATGDYDAYISVKSKNRIHDIAAVKLIIEEAGGCFQEIQTSGPKDYLYQLVIKNNNIVLKETRFDIATAGNTNLYQKIIRKIDY